jgi:hypothetical protein
MLESTPIATRDEFAGSELLCSLQAAPTAVPFGKALIVVLPFVVLVWNAKRLLSVALLMSPVMRWAVLENVRLPVVIVAEAAARLVSERLLIVTLVTARFVTVAEV